MSNFEMLPVISLQQIIRCRSGFFFSAGDTLRVIILYDTGTLMIKPAGKIRLISPFPESLFPGNDCPC